MHMNRSEFLKNIIGLFGVAVLPPLAFKNYQKIYLLQCFIRGFKYSAGPRLLDVMSEGSLLELVREPENPHDTCAIALHFNRQKIGFIPMESNEILSRLIDSGLVELLAEITHLNKDAATWENVHVAISLLKETDHPLPESAAYLTLLETPDYCTVRYPDNQISKVNTQGKNSLSGNDFYEKLLENSDTDEIYSIIHNDFDDAEEMEEAVDQSLIVINKKRLPADLMADEVTHAIEEGMIQLEDVFGEDGYVVAQVDRVARLSARIDRFEKVLDKTGRQFFEVIFKS